VEKLLDVARRDISFVIYMALKGSIPKSAVSSIRPSGPACWAFPGGRDLHEEVKRFSILPEAEMATSALVATATAFDPLCRSSVSLERIDSLAHGFVAQRCGNAVSETNQPIEREVCQWIGSRAFWLWRPPDIWSR